MKELDPVGGGHAGSAPLDPPMTLCNERNVQLLPLRVKRSPDGVLYSNLMTSYNHHGNGLLHHNNHTSVHLRPCASQPCYNGGNCTEEMGGGGNFTCKYQSECFGDYFHFSCYK